MTVPDAPIGGPLFDELGRFANLLHTNSHPSTKRRTRIRTLQCAYERRLREVIAAGIAKVALAARDPEETIFTLLRPCLGVADWYAPGGRLPAEMIVEQVTDQVFHRVLRPAG
jgi:hypothetical protein